MNAARIDEKPKTWFRSERVFLSDEKWFFHTREGVDVGPYDSQFEAEIEAGMLRELLREREAKGDAELLREREVKGDASISVIREFVLDSYAMGRPLTPNFSQAISNGS